METCCTCATLLPRTYPQPSEASQPGGRRVQCCARFICAKCIEGNERFATYCPYCQVSIAPSPLPQRLRDPPAYTSVPSTRSTTADVSVAPPPYTPTSITKPGRDAGHGPGSDAAQQKKEKKASEDTLHFLDHDHDSITALSFRYRVPASALRRTNNITSDHLLLGRKTILIPGEYYTSGVSLSPRPVQGEEEELRKSKIRRFMTSCKVADYDVALLYLEQAGYDLGAAMDSYLDDKTWEKNHPQPRPGEDAVAGRRHKGRTRLWRGL